MDAHELMKEAGACLKSGVYTDLDIRCKGGEVLRAHRLVLAAVSPFIKQVIYKKMVKLSSLPGKVSAITALIVECKDNTANIKNI